MQGTSAPALFDELVRCRGWIEASLACADGTHTFDDVAAGVLSGRFMLWPRERCCAVLEVLEYPRSRELNVFLAGGELEQIQASQEELFEIARNCGAQAVTMTGRRGWVRALPGWQEQHVVLRKEVADG